MPPIAKTKNILMYSATPSTEMHQFAKQYFNKCIFLSVGNVAGACQNIQQTFFQLHNNEKRNKLMEILHENDPSGTIIFVETNKEAVYLTSFLCESDVSTTSIYSDRTQQQRETALDGYKKGIFKILVATTIASRGLGM